MPLGLTRSRLFCRDLASLATLLLDAPHPRLRNFKTQRGRAPLFDRRGVSFVSITQSFNTTSSMGRLTLNMLLSFAQFEREVTAERIRDKIAASKARGMWMGGNPPLGYRPDGRTLAIVEDHADISASVRQHEPQGALFAGPDGLDAYRILIPQLPAMLCPGGAALVEIGSGQAESVTAIAHASGFSARLHRDLAARPRVLELVHMR